VILSHGSLVLGAERLHRVDVVAQSIAGTIALELALGGDPRISQEEFSAAFRRSPMKRAKLRRPKSNAVVVPGDVSQDASRTAASGADQ